MSRDAAARLARQLERNAKRAAKERQSLQILERAGITWRTNDRGGVAIEHGDQVIDLWPGSGIWAMRGGRRNRGVFALLKRLGLNAGARADNNLVDDDAHEVRERRAAVCTRCLAEIVYLTRLTDGRRIAIDPETVAPDDESFDASAHSPHVCLAKR